MTFWSNIYCETKTSEHILEEQVNLLPVHVVDQRKANEIVSKFTATSTEILDASYQQQKILRGDDAKKKHDTKAIIIKATMCNTD